MLTESPFSPDQFKAEFPIFQQRDNKNLVYLDNAATTQKPQSVLDQLLHYYIHSNGNANRASHRLARQATDLLETARQTVARLLNAEKQEIIFCRGATEGLNLVAYTLANTLPEGVEIIVSAAEHHANFLPWQQLARMKHGQLKCLPLKNGAPDLAQLPALMTEKTAVIAITAASNILGVETDLSLLPSVLGDHNPIVVLDAAQLLPHRAIDVTRLPCDFLVFSGHKTFGPMGAGVLYGKSSVLGQLSPWHLGGEMVDQVRWVDSDFAPAPRRFEAGTLSVADIVGLSAAIEFMNQQNRLAIQKYEHHLVSNLHEGLFSLPEICCLTSVDGNLGIATCTFSENHRDRNLQDLAQWFDEHNIAVRVGQHCAQPLYQFLGVRAGGLRFSIAPYNLPSDIDFTLNVLSDWLTMTRPKAVNNMSTSSDNGFPALMDDLSFVSTEALLAQKNWQNRYRLLMQWGARIKPKPALRKSMYQVSGCEANTWLAHWHESGKVYFILDSESKIVRGLGALLLLWYQGQTAEEISNFDWRGAAERLGLARHLSESRRNGFYSLIQAVIAYVNKA